MEFGFKRFYLDDSLDHMQPIFSNGSNFLSLSDKNRDNFIIFLKFNKVKKLREKKKNKQICNNILIIMWDRLAEWLLDYIINGNKSSLKKFEYLPKWWKKNSLMAERRKKKNKPLI